jgi:hypothetical protein
MYTETAYGTHYRVFDSVEDLIESSAAASVDRQPLHIFHLEKFVGRDFSTWEEVYTAARAAWPEGVETIRRMADEMADADLPRPANRRRRPRFEEQDGDEVDHDRLRTGQSFWRTTSRSACRAPQTVVIVIDVNAKAKIKHRDILWRGAAAIAMTELLEAADFRVELWIVHRAFKAYADGSSHCHAVCLKRAADPLDVATFASAVSGWFYRSLMFRAKAIGGRQLAGQLGTPLPPSFGDLARLFPGREPILISGAYDYHAAVALARQAMTRLVSPPPPPQPEPEPVAVPQPVPAEKPRELTPAEIAQQQKEIEEARKRWELWLKQNAEQ